MNQGHLSFFVEKWGSLGSLESCIVFDLINSMILAKELISSGHLPLFIALSHFCFKSMDPLNVPPLVTPHAVY